MLMAVLDGIKNKIDPGKPLDANIYEMTQGGAGQDVPSTPGSLEEALDALEEGPRRSCSKAASSPRT